MRANTSGLLYLGVVIADNSRGDSKTSLKAMKPRPIQGCCDPATVTGARKLPFPGELPLEQLAGPWYGVSRCIRSRRCRGAA